MIEPHLLTTYVNFGMGVASLTANAVKLLYLNIFPCCCTPNFLFALLFLDYFSCLNPMLLVNDRGNLIEHIFI